MTGSRLPSGTVAFAFTDVEGSTALLRRAGRPGGRRCCGPATPCCASRRGGRRRRRRQRGRRRLPRLPRRARRPSTGLVAAQARAAAPPLARRGAGARADGRARGTRRAGRRPLRRAGRARGGAGRARSPTAGSWCSASRPRCCSTGRCRSARSCATAAASALRDFAAAGAAVRRHRRRACRRSSGGCARCRPTAATCRRPPVRCTGATTSSPCSPSADAADHGRRAARRRQDRHRAGGGAGRARGRRRVAGAARAAAGGPLGGGGGAVRRSACRWPAGRTPSPAQLAGRDALLVLDGADDRLAEVAELVRRCGRQAPGVRLLVTARSAAGGRGRAVVRLDPLPVPPDDAAPEDVLSAAAVRLLLAGAGRSAGTTSGTPPRWAGWRAAPTACRWRSSWSGRGWRPCRRPTCSTRVDAQLGRAGRAGALRLALDSAWSALPDDARRLWERLSVFAGRSTSTRSSRCAPTRRRCPRTRSSTRSRLLVGGSVVLLEQDACGGRDLPAAAQRPAVRRASG